MNIASEHHIMIDGEELKSLVIPRININGTSKQELMDQFIMLGDMLERLDQHMARMMPHGRDYQTYDEHTRVTTDARNAWTQRRWLILAIKQEIEELAIAINAQ